ncbi:MAG: LOG family protein [Planctomycetota bacterium]
MARRFNIGHSELDHAIDELVESAGIQTSPDLVGELITTALLLGRNRATRGDLKILNRAMRELREAFRVFRPYRHIRKVSVFGSARVKPGNAAWKLARDFAGMVADDGYMVITGAGDGIMGAAQAGAGRHRSFGANIILPFEQRPNDEIKGDAKLVTFKYFFSRKLVFLKETDAVALFPGGFGTLDEGFESFTLMQTGKGSILPVVLVEPPGSGYWSRFARYLRNHLVNAGYISADDMKLFRVFETAAEARDEIRRFYRLYHSSRYVGQTLVLRLQTPLPDAVIRELNREFASLLVKGNGRIRPSPPLDAEATEPELAHLPRLLIPFNRRDFSKLRLLIDRINDSLPSFRPGNPALRYAPETANANGNSA